MKFRLSWIAVALVAVMSGQAMAADMAVKAPRYVDPIAVNWTGGYVGAFAGYHWGSTTSSGCGAGCNGQDVNLGFGGIQAGYDWQLPNNWVVGVMAQVPLVTENPDVTVVGANFRVKPRMEAFAYGRLGYATGNFLPYVGIVGGFARTKIVGPAGTDTATLPAIGVTLGLEYRLARNWSVDVKYVYASLIKETYNLGGGNEKLGDDSSNVMFAINYRF